MMLLNETDFPARNALLQFLSEGPSEGPSEGRTGGSWGELPPPVLPLACAQTKLIKLWLTIQSLVIVCTQAILPHEKPGLYTLNMAMVQSVTRNRRKVLPRMRAALDYSSQTNSWTMRYLGYRFTKSTATPTYVSRRRIIINLFWRLSIRHFTS